MSIYKVGMPFTHVLAIMKRTGRRAIRSPETVTDEKDKTFRVFLPDATLTLKRYVVEGKSDLRVTEIGAPVKSASDTLKEMTKTLREKMLELTRVEWRVACKVRLPKYQFQFITGKFIALSPEFELGKLFSEPPELDSMASLIATLYNNKNNDQKPSETND